MDILYDEMCCFSQEHGGAKQFLLLNGIISPEMLGMLYDEIKQIKDEKEVYIVLNSYGGDGDSAFKIIRLLKNKFEKVYGIIPTNANSAATLISLGFDKIYMSPIGELSPLDVQVLRKEQGDIPKRQSPLDHITAIDQILNIGFQAFKNFYINIPQPLTEIDKIDLSIKFSNSYVEHLLKQINPIELGNMTRSNLVAIDYGTRILREYKHWNNEKAQKFMKSIVHDYPSHSSVIDANELKRLGFDDVEVKKYLKTKLHIFYQILNIKDKVIVKVFSIKSNNESSGSKVITKKKISTSNKGEKK